LVTIGIMFIASSLFAGPYTLSSEEETLATTIEKDLDTTVIHWQTEQIIQTAYKRTIDANGKIIAVERYKEIFQNEIDNPETEEDETSNEATQWIIGSRLKIAFVKSAMIAKITEE